MDFKYPWTPPKSELDETILSDLQTMDISQDYLKEPANEILKAKALIPFILWSQSTEHQAINIDKDILNQYGMRQAKKFNYIVASSQKNLEIIISYSAALFALNTGFKVHICDMMDLVSLQFRKGQYEENPFEAIQRKALLIIRNATRTTYGQEKVIGNLLSFFSARSRLNRITIFCDILPDLTNELLSDKDALLQRIRQWLSSSIWNQAGRNYFLDDAYLTPPGYLENMKIINMEL